MNEKNNSNHNFINIFNFMPDKTKSGRVLLTVKIGGVHMSRLVVKPGVTTGGHYYKNTSLIFYVASGSVLARFENVKTKEYKELRMQPVKGVIHVPPFVSLTTANVGFDDAILVFFSNKPLRSDDAYDYEFTQKEDLN